MDENITENTGLGTVIARRVRLPYGGSITSIVLSVILIIASFVGTIYGIIIEIEAMVYSLLAFLIVMSIILVCASVDLHKAIVNNRLPSEYIVLYGDSLYIIDEGLQERIVLAEIVDFYYKSAKSIRATSRYYSVTTYNYGTVYIYTKQYRYKLKNVFEANVFYNRLREILGLDNYRITIK